MNLGVSLFLSKTHNQNSQRNPSISLNFCNFSWQNHHIQNSLLEKSCGVVIVFFVSQHMILPYKLSVSERKLGLFSFPVYSTAGWAWITWVSGVTDGLSAQKAACSGQRYQQLVFPSFKSMPPINHSFIFNYFWQSNISQKVYKSV